MKKEIYEDEFKCFVCLSDERELTLFGEDDTRVYLVCEPCRMRTARNLLKNETLQGL